MTGPKHLWSGGWEDESVTPSPPSGGPAATGDEAPRPEPEQPQRPHRRIGRAAWIATGAVVLVAAAAIVLPNLRSSPAPSRTTPPAPTTLSTPTPPGTPTFPRTQTIPTVPTTPTTPGPSATSPTPSAAVPSPTVPIKPISWLGMEIVTLAPDAAVVETVALNSEGDRAGVEPGDVIQTVGGHAVVGAEGIISAVKDLHSGDAVQLQIARRSAIFETEVRMAAPPTSP